jgi:hypothetical protein
VLIPQANDAKKYWKILVDDTAEAAAALRRQYPALAAELRYPTARSAENKYADAKLLEACRRDIARAAWVAPRIRTRFNSSADDGATWTNSVWYARKEPLHHLASIKFANGKSGYYVYATFSPDPLAPQVLYSEFGRANYRNFDIPKIDDWQRLIETRKGVLVGPHRTGRLDGQERRPRLELNPDDRGSGQRSTFSSLIGRREPRLKRPS